jgi:predicted Ser/Thr protein kinase
MATEANIRLPDDLLAQVRDIAAREGKTPDEMAAEALKRDIARRLIADMKRTRKPSGMTEEQEMQTVVDAVHDYRRGR